MQGRNRSPSIKGVRPLFAIALLAAVSAALAGCTGVPAAATKPSLAIVDVTVVDVDGGQRHPHQTVLVEGDRIRAVGPSAEITVPVGAETLDGKGRYLIPGLWDVHAHLTGSSFDAEVVLPTYLANGVTSVREMWSGPPDVVVDEVHGTTREQALRHSRAQAAGGSLAGPRLMLVSAPLDGPFDSEGYMHVVRTAAEATSVVDSIAERNLDAVGVYAWLGPDAYAAAAAAARRHSLPLYGLGPVAATFEEMTAAGHLVRDGLLVWEIACSPKGEAVRASLRDAARRDAVAQAAPRRPLHKVFAEAGPGLRASFDRERCSRAMRSAAARGTWYVPRLSYYGSAEASRRGNTRRGLAYFPADFRKAWEERTAVAQRDDGSSASSQARFNRTVVRMLHDAGIPLLVGTESYWGSAGAWGFSVHDELVELVGAGLTPLDALQAATLEPARALGQQADLGTVEAGRLADLVLLDADPVADIANARKVHAVLKSGRLYRRSDLDALLSAAAAASAREE